MIERAMMSAPFLLVFAALLATWSGRHGASLFLWMAGILALLVLFRLHATSELGIAL
jgi:hypothetical protein